MLCIWCAQARGQHLDHGTERQCNGLAHCVSSAEGRPLCAQGNGKGNCDIYSPNSAFAPMDRRDTGGRRYGAVGSRVGLIIQRSSVRSRLAAIHFAGSICCLMTIEPGTLSQDPFCCFTQFCHSRQVVLGNRTGHKTGPSGP
jgi:hypothetical protein